MTNLKRMQYYPSEDCRAITDAIASAHGKITAHDKAVLARVTRRLEVRGVSHAGAAELVGKLYLYFKQNNIDIGKALGE